MRTRLRSVRGTKTTDRIISSVKLCSNKTHAGDNPVPLDCFHRNKRADDGLQWYCKACRKATYVPKVDDGLGRGRRPRADKREIAVMRSVRYIRARAKPLGIPYAFGLSDLLPLPTHCPDLGIPLIYGNKTAHSPNSASIDKIVPELGYVSGNVRIVSYRANAMKQDASLVELQTIAQSWMRLVDQHKMVHI